MKRKSVWNFFMRRKSVWNFFMRRKSAWKKPEDVKSVSFSVKRNRFGKIVLDEWKSRQLIRIGGNFLGDVYAGKIRFNDGKRHWVAIKKFKEPLKESEANAHQLVINDLRKAKVRIPKMGMLRLPTGEWVLVSQLFGSIKQGSKIQAFGVNALQHITTISGKKEAVIEFAKIVNAGYDIATDPIEQFKEKEKGVIPIDLDLIVHRGKTGSSERAAALFANILDLSKEPSERKKLMRTAMRALNNEMKMALKKTLNRHGFEI